MLIVKKKWFLIIWKVGNEITLNLSLGGNHCWHLGNSSRIFVETHTHYTHMHVSGDTFISTRTYPSTYVSRSYFAGFLPVVLDIRSPSITYTDFKSIIFNGCCMVTHSKDTLFHWSPLLIPLLKHSAKQTASEPQNGAAGPFPEIKHFGMNRDIIFST